MLYERSQPYYWTGDYSCYYSIFHLPDLSLHIQKCMFLWESKILTLHSINGLFSRLFPYFCTSVSTRYVITCPISIHLKIKFLWDMLDPHSAPTNACFKILSHSTQMNMHVSTRYVILLPYLYTSKNACFYEIS